MKTTARYRFIRIFFLSASILLLLVSSPLFLISAAYLQIAMLGLIATVGLSHGSLDWLLARHWGLRSTWWQSFFFLLAYSLVVLVGLLIWWLNPTVGLVIFLLMSVTHFASDWQNELHGLMAYSAGLAVVALPTLFFQQEVVDLFSLLVGVKSAIYLTVLLRNAGIIAVTVVLMQVVKEVYCKSNYWLALELITLIILGLTLQPILYFSMYFCFLHGLKHYKSMQEIGLYTQFYKVIFSAAWPTLVCLIIGLLTYQYTSQLKYNTDYIPIIFIGLAALSIPHWLLLEIYPKTR